MKFKGKLRDKLFSLLFLVVAIGITYYVYTDARNTREEITIPIISRDIKYGDLIGPSDVSTTTVGKYKLDSNILTIKEDIIGQYAIRDMYQGRFYYKQDISNAKPPTEIREKIEEGAMAVETNLVKCVGGIPQEGDYVKVNIIKKSDANSQTVEVIQYSELARLKILDIKNNSSESIHKEKQTSGLGTVGSSQSKPDLVIFEVNKEQEAKLLLGQYTGDIHLVLLPKENDVAYESKKENVNGSVNVETIESAEPSNVEVIKEETSVPTNIPTTVETPKENKNSGNDDEGYNNKPKDLVPNIPSTNNPQPPKDNKIIIEESNDFDIAP